MWQGFYSSLRPGINRVFLNVDITSAPMYTAGNLSVLMQNFGRQMSRGQPGPPPDISAAKIQRRLQVNLARSVSDFRSCLEYFADLTSSTDSSEVSKSPSESNSPTVPSKRERSSRWRKWRLRSPSSRSTVHPPTLLYVCRPPRRPLE